MARRAQGVLVLAGRQRASSARPLRPVRPFGSAPQCNTTAPGETLTLLVYWQTLLHPSLPVVHTVAVFKTPSA